MGPSAALVHLIRMRDMKQRRLDNWRGNSQTAHFLRADISALNYAIGLAEAAVDAIRKQLREREETTS